MNAEHMISSWPKSLLVKNFSTRNIVPTNTAIKVSPSKQLWLSLTSNVWYLGLKLPNSPQSENAWHLFRVPLPYTSVSVPTVHYLEWKIILWYFLLALLMLFRLKSCMCPLGGLVCCSYICIYKFKNFWMYFHEISYWRVLLKSVERIQWHLLVFLLIPLALIMCNILNSQRSKKCYKQYLYKKIKHILSRTQIIFANHRFANTSKQV